jgi:hypothetical protein
MKFTTWVGLLVSAVLASSCGHKTFTCPTNSHPCGTGCIPTNAVCCDDGTGKTSSYCTNGAGGCYANDRGCSAVFPAGQTAEFCCSATGNIGTNDCPSGQKHCGTLCQPDSQPCCPEGATATDCPEKNWDDTACAKTGGIVCGVCTATGVCKSCPRGSCCQAGIACGTSDSMCIPGPACTDVSGAGGGSGGNCSQYQNICGTSGGMQSLGGYYPKSCACPAGMSDQGGSHLNELCGLAGQGYDCHYCTCP